MKKMFFSTLCMAVVLFSMISVNVARSADIGPPEYAGVDPSGNRDTLEITIPALPDGKELVNVYLWNDCKGTPGKPLGAVHGYKFRDKCDSSNFLWKNKGETTLHWQLIRRQSKPGGELKSIPDEDGNYKYGFIDADVNRK